MPKSATIQARIDPDTKSQAQGILNNLNMTLSEAISVFLRQVVLTRGIPFDLKVPNDLTVRTLEKSKAGKEIHEVSSVDELFKELNA